MSKKSVLEVHSIAYLHVKDLTKKEWVKDWFCPEENIYIFVFVTNFPCRGQS